MRPSDNAREQERDTVAALFLAEMRLDLTSHFAQIGWMRFFLLLSSSLADFAAFLGKWLFVVIAPVLLIVAGSYYQAGESVFEPISGLVLLAGIFVATRSFSARLNGIPHVGRETETVFPKATVPPSPSAAEIWNLHLEDCGRNLVAATKETRRANQRQAELWKQADPWGGYNPHE